jgi:hypothetical protein
MDRQTTRQHAAWAAPLAWLRVRVTACGRGVVLGVLALAEAVLMHPVVFAAAFLVPIPGIGSAARRLADLTRKLCGDWCGMPIASPTGPRPPERASLGRLLSGSGDGGLWPTRPPGVTWPFSS